MANEVFLILLRANLAMPVAVIVVLLARDAFRRRCGADIAYVLWLAVPVTGLTAVIVSLTGDQMAARMLSPVVETALILKLWLAGAGAALGVLAFGHRQVLRRADRGDFGPAVVGLLNPKTYLPADFTERFDEGERAVIRAHERAHIMRHDAPVTYALALAQCLFWFNPFIHLGAEYLRRDQEMACDRTVMEDRPEQRGLYARTMLKAQLGGRSTVFGCGWAKHPLEERVRALRETPSDWFRVMGIMVLVAATFQVLILLGLAVR